MKRFIKYPSINQFRNVAKSVEHSARFAGFDEESKPIIDHGAKLPVITAIGTEKIHGTNAAVCYSEPDGFWVQSRKNIITPEKDNAACAFAVMRSKDAWMDIIKSLAAEHGVDLNNYIISVYFEWAGGNIQKNSALTGLDKRAIIFRHFKVSPLEPSDDESTDETGEKSIWYETHVGDAWVNNPEHNIWNISNFQTYVITIDFENSGEARNKMVELIDEIEKSSPVGKSFGKDDNIGEGVVFSFNYNDSFYRFKVKGEKHAGKGSKVKTLPEVDCAREQALNDLARQVTPAWRLEQMYNEANDTINGGEPDVRNIGTYMKMLNNDIIKEESDTIAEAGFEPKDVFSRTARIAKAYFFEQMNG